LSAIKKIFLSAALSIGHESGITSTGATPEVLPLSQTNFLPDLIQVKVLPPATDLIPALVHLAPALVAECAGIGWKVSVKLMISSEKDRTLPVFMKLVSTT
jgi:hypothetical protein